MLEEKEIKILEIKEKSDWELFLYDCDKKSFLNSWNWGEFNQALGNKIWRWGFFSQREQVASALVIKIEAKRATFFFVPHGPNLKKGKEIVKFKVLNSLTEELRKIWRKEKVDFLRIAPIWENNEEDIKIFKELGFKKAPIHIHPELTWELDINLSEEEILRGMRKTTRYLIRQAEKNKDIEIEEKNTLEAIEKFNTIYQETKERQRFVPFSLDYLKKEFLSFFPDNQISILLGKYKKEIVAGGIFIFWQGRSFYHHGASSLKYPKIPVSYLLLWQAIKKAKKLGCEKFNFWGISDLKQKNHPWYGLSLFKIGFGGYAKEYLRTQDFPFTFRYWLNYLVEKIRKKKRGY